MSVTSGFFNSLDGDRKYNAEQMSALFDGIINDGILATIGNAFAITAAGDFDITVDTGRAWFNSTWILNDSILTLTLDDSESVLDRYDAIVIEVDHSESVRACDIKVVTGTAASSPSYPTLTDDDDVHQYPLAYIFVEAGSTEISQSDITSVIGGDDCPYVTGLLEVVSIASVVAQWEAQWAAWYSTITSEGESDLSEWLSAQQATYNTWLSSLQDLLSDDAETEMAARLLEMEEKWEILLTEHCIYESVEDSDDDELLDSYDDGVIGKVVYVIA